MNKHPLQLEDSKWTVADKYNGYLNFKSVSFDSFVRMATG